MAKKNSKERGDEQPAKHQVPVRLPHRTWEELVQDAEANYRTLNMHILWLIEERLRQVRADKKD